MRLFNKRHPKKKSGGDSGEKASSSRECSCPRPQRAPQLPSVSRRCLASNCKRVPSLSSAPAAPVWSVPTRSCESQINSCAPFQRPKEKRILNLLLLILSASKVAISTTPQPRTVTGHPIPSATDERVQFSRADSDVCDRSLGVCFRRQLLTGIFRVPGLGSIIHRNSRQLQEPILCAWKAGSFILFSCLLAEVSCQIRDNGCRAESPARIPRTCASSSAGSSQTPAGIVEPGFYWMP